MIDVFVSGDKIHNQIGSEVIFLEPSKKLSMEESDKWVKYIIEKYKNAVMYNSVTGEYEDMFKW